MIIQQFETLGIGRRTKTDFSKHTHTCKKLVDDDTTAQIDSLQVGDSLHGAVHFVNTPFGMSVYGDYGNWVFNRRFIPNNKGESVSDHYWIEKLQLNAQGLEFWEYDKELNKEHLEELKEEIPSYGLSEDSEEEAMEWVDDLLWHLEDEDWVSYTNIVYHETPPCMQGENLPIYKAIPIRLQVVFDAFEEICNRLKNEDDEE